MRAAIRAATPDAVEKISYQMPTFALNGNLVHFAAFKTTSGSIRRRAASRRSRTSLSVYKGAKGSVQFPLDEPLPLDLVRRIVEFRVAENLGKARDTDSITMSWQLLEDQQPELAAFGVERLNGRSPIWRRYAGIARHTSLSHDADHRAGPSVRVHGSDVAQGHDLRRDGRYAIHGGVSDNNGAGGEFFVTGQAHLVSDPELHTLAAQLSSYNPAERYILFEFDLESAGSTVYTDQGSDRRFRSTRHLT